MAFWTRAAVRALTLSEPLMVRDRKSTRLNSSHQIISYAVFCLKKKKHQLQRSTAQCVGRRGHAVCQIHGENHLHLHKWQTDQAVTRAQSTIVQPADAMSAHNTD